MKATKPDDQHSPFFLFGLSAAIPTWLLFRQSLKSDRWKTSARKHCREHFKDINTTNDAELVHHWLAAQSPYPLIQSQNNWVVCGIGAVLGFLSMLGGLNYSGSEPINLWLLLGLFSFAPLLMCGMTCCAWIRKSLPQNRPSLPPLHYGWANRILTSQLLGLNEPSLQNTTKTYLLQRWLMWRLQGAALAFQLSAIVTFVLVLVFKDIAFGWSSTIIQTDAWIPTFIDILARPWSWLVPPPSAELINNSRFYRGQTTFDAVILSQWWSYVLLAMITYGYAPRLLLSTFMKYQLKKTLIKEMQSSGDIALFIRAIRQVNTSENERLTETTHNERTPDATNIDITMLKVHELDASKYHLVGWQYQALPIKIEGILGKTDWDIDREWIHKHTKKWRKPTAMLVALDQTPTAELADIIEMIREHNSNKKIYVIVCTSKYIESKRELGQLKSWQYFANSNGLDIDILNTHSNEISANS